MSEKGFIELDSNDEVLLTKLDAETYDLLVNWILKYVRKVRFPKFNQLPCYKIRNELRLVFLKIATRKES